MLFKDFWGKYTTRYNMNIIHITPLEIKTREFLLGLNFLIVDSGGITITGNSITIFKNSHQSPTNRYNKSSELLAKRGGPISTTNNLDFLCVERFEEIENEADNMLQQEVFLALGKGEDTIEKY